MVNVCVWLAPWLPVQCTSLCRAGERERKQRPQIYEDRFQMPIFSLIVFSPPALSLSLHFHLPSILPFFLVSGRKFSSRMTSHTFFPLSRWKILHIYRHKNPEINFSLLNINLAAGKKVDQNHPKRLLTAAKIWKLSCGGFKSRGNFQHKGEVKQAGSDSSLMNDLDF